MKNLVTTKSHFPMEPHYAILEFYSIYTPGDERSRTNPGHGYPASTDPASRYYWFTSEKHWKKYILDKLTRGEKNFIALNKGVYYEPKLKVSLD